MADPWGASTPYCHNFPQHTRPVVGSQCHTSNAMSTSWNILGLLYDIHTRSSLYCIILVWYVAWIVYIICDLSLCVFYFHSATRKLASYYATLWGRYQDITWCKAESYLAGDTANRPPRTRDNIRTNDRQLACARIHSAGALSWLLLVCLCLFTLPKFCLDSLFLPIW